MDRKQARTLARLATNGEDQIRKEKIYQLNDEKRKFLSHQTAKRHQMLDKYTKSIQTREDTIALQLMTSLVRHKLHNTKIGANISQDDVCRSHWLKLPSLLV